MNLKRVLPLLAGSDILRAVTPGWVKRLARKGISASRYDQRVWATSNPWVGTSDEWSFTGEGRHKIGILYSHAHDHHHYMAACHELEISYEVIDIRSNDWIPCVQRSGCDVFLVWPCTYLGIWKELYDERLRIMTEDLGYKVYPSEKEVWLYESKRRTRDWLEANALPYPQTWVFFEEDEALSFLADAPIPIVFKADRSASSHGVVICRHRGAAINLVNRCFGRGFVPERGDRDDPQRGVVVFQEFLPDVKEWRMVRIGDSLICREKGRLGDFHSGSGLVAWARPTPALLKLAWDVTERGRFRSMDVDVFETHDGRLLVNELHTVFGAIEESNLGRGTEYMGRWLQVSDGEWRFEPGYFYDHACANLRVEEVLRALEADG